MKPSHIHVWNRGLENGPKVEPEEFKIILGEIPLSDVLNMEDYVANHIFQVVKAHSLALGINLRFKSICDCNWEGRTFGIWKES